LDDKGFTSLAKVKTHIMSLGVSHARGSQ